MPRKRSSGKGKSKGGNDSGDQEYYYPGDNTGGSMSGDGYIDPRNLALDQQAQGYYDGSQSYMTPISPSAGSSGQEFDPYATPSSPTPYSQDFYQTPSTFGYDTPLNSAPTNSDLPTGQADLSGQRTNS